MREASNKRKVYCPMRDNPHFDGSFPRRFRTVEGCLQHIFGIRGANIQCPKCGRAGSYYFHRHPSKLCYTCNCGRYQFFPLKGTIFEHSFLPLPKWFYGLFLMSKKPVGITSKELERELDVAYATAWRMTQQFLSVKPPKALWRHGSGAVFNAYLQNAIAPTSS